MTEAGIRDLRTHLSSYLRQVEAGKTVVVTRHGKPIARIVPATESTEAQLDRLRQAGLIDWNEWRLPPLAPVTLVLGGTQGAEPLCS